MRPTRRGKSHEGQIQGPGQHVVDQRNRQPLPQIDGDIGERRVIGGEHGCNASPHEADRDAPAHAANRLIDDIPCRGHGGEDSFRLGQQCLSGLAQFNAASGANEQRSTQVVLESANRGR